MDHSAHDDDDHRIDPSLLPSDDSSPELAYPSLPTVSVRPSGRSQNIAQQFASIPTPHPSPNNTIDNLTRLSIGPDLYVATEWLNHKRNPLKSWVWDHGFALTVVRHTKWKRGASVWRCKQCDAANRPTKGLYTSTSTSNAINHLQKKHNILQDGTFGSPRPPSSQGGMMDTSTAAPRERRRRRATAASQRDTDMTNTAEGPREDMPGATTPQEFLDHLCDWVTKYNIPFEVLDAPEFRRLFEAPRDVTQQFFRDPDRFFREHERYFRNHERFFRDHERYFNDRGGH